MKNMMNDYKMPVFVYAIKKQIITNNHLTEIRIVFINGTHVWHTFQKQNLFLQLSKEVPSGADIKLREIFFDFAQVLGKLHENS